MLVVARPELVRTFAPYGVQRVEYPSAFPDQDQFAVSLGSASDAEAERLRRQPDLRARVAAVLTRAGFSESELAGLMVVTPSQETVDREYDGRWFYALR